MRSSGGARAGRRAARAARIARASRPSRSPWAAGVAGALALAACYAPQFDDGLPCSSTGQCPSGQTCDLTASPPVCLGGLDLDAGVDGLVPDGGEGQDSDLDGIVDREDNCPTLPNPLQRDHDDDTIGDRCDNCPGVANPTQANTTEAIPDGVGDACDPWPSTADRIALFDGFDDGLANWRIEGTATVTGGYLVPDPMAAFADTAILSVATFPDARRVAIEIGAEVDAFENAMSFPTLATMVEYSPGMGDDSSQYECGLSFDPGTIMTHSADLHAVVNDQYAFLAGDNLPATNGFVRMRLAYLRPTGSVSGHAFCAIQAGNAATTLDGDHTGVPRGLPGFFVFRTRAQFDYAVIYVDGPTQ